MSTVFRSSTPTPPVPVGEDVEPNLYGAEINLEGIEPIEFKEERAGNIVLEALGLSDDASEIESEDQKSLDDIRRYVVEILNKEGQDETVDAFKKKLNSLKEDMGLPENVAPDIFIKRLSSVINAWRDLSFIKDDDKRQKVFMKLATLETTKDINKTVLEEMENYKVWQ
jgi:hypothetical protein